MWVRQKKQPWEEALINMEVRPRISRLSPPASLCDCVLSISHSEAQSHFSQFNVYFAAAIYAQTHSWLYVKRHTHKHTNQTRDVTQSCSQNASSQADGDSKWPTVGWRVCVCVYRVRGTQCSSVLCWLRCWQRPSDGSIQTSNKDCTVQLRRETVRG